MLAAGRLPGSGHSSSASTWVDGPVVDGGAVDYRAGGLGFAPDVGETAGGVVTVLLGAASAAAGGFGGFATVSERMSSSAAWSRSRASSNAEVALVEAGSSPVVAGAVRTGSGHGRAMLGGRLGVDRTGGGRR